MKLAEANASALMEAVEFAVAESASAGGAEAWMSVPELVRQLPDGLRLADFAPRLGGQLASQARIAVVRCEEIISRTTTFLPAELVLVPCPAYGRAPLFGWSTNGLASGNTLDEATLHGLLEIAERDSIAMNLARDESCLLGNVELPAPFKTSVIEWRRRGIELIVRYVPNDVGLPCFQAAIYDPSNRGLTLACGWGMHLERRIALSRAVCEAAQQRLVALHGLRYAPRAGKPAQKRAIAAARRGASSAVLAMLKDDARRIGFRSVPTEMSGSVTAALETCDFPAR